MKRAVTILLAAVMFGSASTSAIAATRYCGTGAKYSGLQVTRYVSPAWDRPGWRLMSTRKVWSATPRYYACRPRTS